MEQTAPCYSRIASTSEFAARVAASIGISHTRLNGDPFVVSTGNAFLLISLPDEKSVALLRPNLEKIAKICDELDVVGFYVFSKGTKSVGRQAGARMFAPRFGIAEEAATGTAAGPLACLLYDHGEVSNRTIEIEQGQLMGTPSPSVIEVRLEVTTTGITRLMVGGEAKIGHSIRVNI